MTFNAEATTQNGAEMKVLNKAFDYLSGLGRDKTRRSNKKVLVKALIDRTKPLLDRVLLVLECLRGDTGFDSTEDVLSEKERELLILIDKRIRIDSTNGTSPYKATLKIKDAENIVREASSLMQARNDTCLAAFNHFTKLRIWGLIESNVVNLMSGLIEIPPEHESVSTVQEESKEVIKDEILQELSPTEIQSYRKQIIGSS